MMRVQIGKALMEALKKLVSEDKLPPGLAVRVMKAFDRVRVYEVKERIRFMCVCVCVCVVHRTCSMLLRVCVSISHSVYVCVSVCVCVCVYVSVNTDVCRICMSHWSATGETTASNTSNSFRRYVYREIDDMHVEETDRERQTERERDRERERQRERERDRDRARQRETERERPKIPKRPTRVSKQTPVWGRRRYNRFAV